MTSSKMRRPARSGRGRRPAHSGLAAILGLLLTAACGGSSGPGPGLGPSQEAVVGKSCRAQADCAGLAEGYCSQAAVCSRRCTANSDCGCAPGTTVGDVIAGRCAAACVGGKDSAGQTVYVCIRACKTNRDCDRGICKTLKDGLSICL